jgi:hypothetical protein
MAARSLPSCPPIFAKCVPFASENFLWHQKLPSIASMHASGREIMLKERSQLCTAPLQVDRQGRNLSACKHVSLMKQTVHVTADSPEL